ncbi:dense granule protein GRA15 [Toxoplasma gondii VEG]|uniref:Dense granule protein GRA15 n=1 Tax=Toxoplasma gondii (strain ATCC 50861 / VEG) TaxID=432359 RepID=V4Z7A0_TOXGV|nr:dense granule protein GRA15 [Toxoplasma gondii VEG]CEL77158.1 TPA: dense granule protein GRA15 [Toxoplasma gondii VEG]
MVTTTTPTPPPGAPAVVPIFDVVYQLNPHVFRSRFSRRNRARRVVSSKSRSIIRWLGYLTVLAAVILLGAYAVRRLSRDLSDSVRETRRGRRITGSVPPGTTRPRSESCTGTQVDGGCGADTSTDGKSESEQTENGEDSRFSTRTPIHVTASTSPFATRKAAEERSSSPRDRKVPEGAQLPTSSTPHAQRKDSGSDSRNPSTLIPSPGTNTFNMNFYIIGAGSSALDFIFPHTPDAQATVVSPPRSAAAAPTVETVLRVRTYSTPTTLTLPTAPATATSNHMHASVTPSPPERPQNFRGGLMRQNGMVEGTSLTTTEAGMPAPLQSPQHIETEARLTYSNHLKSSHTTETPTVHSIDPVVGTSGHSVAVGSQSPAGGPPTDSRTPAALTPTSSSFSHADSLETSEHPQSGPSLHPLISGIQDAVQSQLPLSQQETLPVVENATFFGPQQTPPWMDETAAAAIPLAPSQPGSRTQPISSPHTLLPLSGGVSAVPGPPRTENPRQPQVPGENSYYSVPTEPYPAQDMSPLIRGTHSQTETVECGVNASSEGLAAGAPSSKSAENAQTGQGAGKSLLPVFLHPQEQSPHSMPTLGAGRFGSGELQRTISDPGPQRAGATQADGIGAGGPRDTQSAVTP